MQRRDVASASTIAISANIRHRVKLEDAYACIAYLDPGRDAFEDVERLADRWREFTSGRDDLRSLLDDARRSPARKTWRAWFELRRAISETLFSKLTLTQAAHRAGFADSAHLTRTCKQPMGVRRQFQRPIAIQWIGCPAP